jgi:hypothetical protein
MNKFDRFMSKLMNCLIAMSSFTCVLLTMGLTCKFFIEYPLSGNLFEKIICSIITICVFNCATLLLFLFTIREIWGAEGLFNDNN